MKVSTARVVIGHRAAQVAGEHEQVAGVNQPIELPTRLLSFRRGRLVCVVERFRASTAVMLPLARTSATRSTDCQIVERPVTSSCRIWTGPTSRLAA